MAKSKKNTRETRKALARRFEKPGQKPAPASSRPATPQQQVEQAMQKLKKAVGAAASKQAAFRIHENEVATVSLAGTGVADVSMLAGMKIRQLDLQGLPVFDLSPLAGMPLAELYLENTRVSDLAPLAESPIEKLYLSSTPVSDLAPIARCPIRELNLLGTQVADLGPLAAMPLETLWLNDAPVADVGPLANVTTLISLTLAGTQVADLSSLRGLPIQRLHIARTRVADLSPLEGMPLTRLVFNPAQIEKGIETVRAMASITEIGFALEQMMPPAVFWQHYDAMAARRDQRSDDANSDEATKGK